MCFHVGAAPSLKTSAFFFFFSSIFNVNAEPRVKTANTIEIRFTQVPEKNNKIVPKPCFLKKQL